MRFALTLAALSTLGALGSTARAGGDIGVVVTGDGTLQPQLAAQIENWLSQHGHVLVQTPLPPDAIPSLGDCLVLQDPTGCMRQIIEKRAKTTSVVFARFETANNTATGVRDVTLTAYWFDKGHNAVAERKICTHCTDQSLRTTADEVMKNLIGGAAVGHVKLKSNPAGARISIDGKPIGITPLDWDLPPGEHTIQMDKAGLEATRTVIVVSDKTELVALDLGTDGYDDGGKPSRLLPKALLAGGGALIVTGVVFIAINQDDSPNLPKRIRDTKLEGIVFVAGGLGAVVGGYLWFRSPNATSAPVAAFTGDRAYIGWQGRF